MSKVKDIVMYGTILSRPQPSIPGRLFYAVDAKTLYRDNGANWDSVSINGNSSYTNIFNWNYVMGDGSTTIPTGIAGMLEIPLNCEITSVKVVSTSSGSAVIDLWMTPFSGIDNVSHPVAGDSIIGTSGSKITLAGSTVDADLTDWVTTSLAPNNWLYINVDSCTVNLMTLSVTGDMSA